MATQSAYQPDTHQHIEPSAWVRKHPVRAFTILAFTLSWFVWGVCALFPNVPEIVSVWAASRLGTFGPALAAMIIAWILNPTPAQGRRLVWWMVFLGSALFGWLYYSWKGDIAYTARFPISAYVLAAGVMLIWGFMVAGIVGRTQGIRALMRRQIKFPGLGWIALVIAAPLVIELVGLGVTNLFGGNVRPWLITGTWDVILPLIVSVFIGVWIAGGGNEEAGWRFMQSHMQKQFSPLLTAMIIGVVMGFWHFPLHFLGTFAGNDLYAGVAGLAFRIVSNIALGIGFTWLYNRSHGSLLLVILFHVVINTSSVFIASTTLTQVLMFAVMLALVPLDRMWKKLPPDEVETLL